MKLVFALILCLGTLTAFAQEKKGAENFEERKAKLSGHLDERIAALQKAKSCISSAKDDETLKVCKEEMREAHKELRHQMKEKMQKLKKQMKQNKES
ncbi:MAG: hypothetical protein NDI69_13645 [Bacteriovoracaceae bacterium]|nr:hypothetical protein [Bacteriovoracaceae bacterium]